jgi:hypothetical protein
VVTSCQAKHGAACCRLARRFLAFNQHAPVPACFHATAQRKATALPAFTSPLPRWWPRPAPRHHPPPLALLAPVKQGFNTRASKLKAKPCVCSSACAAQERGEAGNSICAPPLDPSPTLTKSKENIMIRRACVTCFRVCWLAVYCYYERTIDQLRKNLNVPNTVFKQVISTSGCFMAGLNTFTYPAHKSQS